MAVKNPENDIVETAKIVLAQPKTIALVGLPHVRLGRHGVVGRNAQFHADKDCLQGLADAFPREGIAKARTWKHARASMYVLNGAYGQGGRSAQKHAAAENGFCFWIV